MATTFQTKKITWFSPLLASHVHLTILVQNENGPCALIAVANTLILAHAQEPASGAVSELAQFVFLKLTVQSSEIVGLLALVLVEKNPAQSETVFGLLGNLHTGLNINPDFVTGRLCEAAGPARFEPAHMARCLGEESALDSALRDLHPERATPAIKDTSSALFEAFGIEIRHGWVADPVADAAEFQTILYLGSFDVCQDFLIYVDDVKEEDVTKEEYAMLRRCAGHVQLWLARTASQLTPLGLETLANNVKENLFVIFFRNDHFTTVLKRSVVNELAEKSFELYSLVTDAGLSRYGDVVWQELKIGFEEFYDMNFMAIVRETLKETPEVDEEDAKLAKKLQEKEDEYVAQRLQKSYEKGLKIPNKRTVEPKKEPIKQSSKKCLIQ